MAYQQSRYNWVGCHPLDILNNHQGALFSLLKWPENTGLPTYSPRKNFSAIQPHPPFFVSHFAPSGRREVRLERGPERVKSGQEVRGALKGRRSLVVNEG